MNVKLVIEKGATRRTLQLRTSVAVVGRARGNAVRIPSAEVSRQHCKLLLEDGVVRVEDLGSVNGTLLNGKRVRGIEYVRPGDSLRVGPVTFAVEYELSPSAEGRLGGEDADVFAQLDQLADGEAVVEMEEEAPLEADELLPADDADEILLPADEEDVPALGDSEPWQMPDASTFRDMLSQLEDEDDSPPRKKR